MQRAVLQHVHPRVADIHDREALVRLDHHERDCAQGRAHPADRVVGVRHLEDPGVRHLDGSNERLERVIGDRGAQRVEREPRGHLARCVTAHAVRDGEQREGDEPAVLVRAAHATGVGRRAPAQAGREV